MSRIIRVAVTPMDQAHPALVMGAVAQHVPVMGLGEPVGMDHRVLLLFLILQWDRLARRCLLQVLFQNPVHRLLRLVRRSHLLLVAVLRFHLRAVCHRVRQTVRRPV